MTILVILAYNLKTIMDKKNVEMFLMRSIGQTMWQTRWFFIPYCQLSFQTVATSLQHLCMMFPYHNSYIIPTPAVTTQTFCIALDFLQLGFWNRVMLLQDWSLHYKSSWSSSWTLDRYGVSICTNKHFVEMTLIKMHTKVIIRLKL